MALTVSELANKLGLQIFCGKENIDRIVKGGYVSDLLSDVMGNASEGEAWITLQSHMNVIAIASLKDLPCVIFVKGIVPPPEVVDKANEEGIALLGSTGQTFNLAGKIYQLLE